MENSLPHLLKVPWRQKQKHLQLILLAVLLLLSPIWAYGQARTITGKLIDEAGAPLPGVNIIVKGTTTGTLSDIDGNYRLESWELPIRVRDRGGSRAGIYLYRL